MLIKKIRFLKPFRCYTAGHTITLKDRVTVIVGDNGAGKSSLLALLRTHFESAYTPSSLAARDIREVLEITPEVPAREKITYIDIATDLLSTRGEMDEEHFDLQVRMLHKSSGQGALLQAMNILLRSKAKVHILDEPERGLSPAKQWVLAAALQHIIKTRPDDQFLVCTHSPQIMHALGSEVLQLTQGAYVGIDDYLAACASFGMDQADRYIQALIEEGREAST